MDTPLKKSASISDLNSPARGVLDCDVRKP